MDGQTPQEASKRSFKLLRCIGKGGFGEVYLAHMSTSSGFAKTVAIKVLRPDMEGMEQVAARLRDEARMLGLISHPAVVEAQDLITLAGRPAVVMEYVPGVNLNWIINPKRFPLLVPASVVLAVVREVAGALDAAFNRPSTVTGEPLEILHRDVKPANIRITPDGVVKILDFGIARSTQMDREAETKAHQLGSLGYMAPELMDGGRASPASDVYALGIVLFESLARVRFGWPASSQEAHDAAVEERSRSQALDALGEHRDQVMALVTEMVAFAPGLRPTAAQVRRRCRQLDRLVDGPLPEEWIPEILDQVATPDDPEGVDLTGKTLFEETSRSISGDVPLGDDLQLPPSDDDLQLPPSDYDLQLPPSDYDLQLPPSDDATAIAPLEFEPRSAVRPVADEGPPWGLIAAAVLLLVALGLGGWWVFGRNPAPDPVVEVLEPEPAPVVEPPPEPAVAEAPPEPEVEEAPPEPEVEEDLPAEPAPTVVAAPPVRAAPEVPAGSPPSEPEPAASAVEARLSSVPFGIEIYVDGSARGKTPVTLDLLPGPHAVMYLDGADTVRAEVVVVEGGSNFFNYIRSEGVVK